MMDLSQRPTIDSAMRAAVDPKELLETLRPLLAAPSPDALATFEAAYESIRGTPAEHASEALVECLLLISHFNYLSLKGTSALQPASEAAAYARRLGDRRLLRKALTVLGVMQMETGNLLGAMEANGEALELARDLAEPELAAPVWNNIGAALMSGTQYADALKCSERAATLARGSQKSVEPIALSNAAQCALQLRDAAGGLKFVRRSIELNPDPQTAQECLDRVLSESNYARLLLEVGELARAEEHCDLARLYASRASSARAEYGALQASGLVDVSAGRIDIGLKRLNDALQHAREHIWLRMWRRRCRCASTAIRPPASRTSRSSICGS
jgi:tetratricopeptide (TPR) repeat protein